MAQPPTNKPIIIRVVKKKRVRLAGHSGSWKVAYADFVTAMMAFFLLMWLINTTSPEQKRGIADYFAPASVSETTSGSGGILAGTALGNEGSKQNGSMSVIQDASPDSRGRLGAVRGGVLAGEIGVPQHRSQCRELPARLLLGGPLTVDLLDLSRVDDPGNIDLSVGGDFRKRSKDRPRGEDR